MSLRNFHPGRYLLEHWQGRLPLSVSVLINLVLLRILASLMQPFLSPPQAPAAVLLVYVILTHVALLVWQLVGVIRASEHYFQNTSFRAPVLGAQITAFMAIILTLPQYMAAYYATLDPPAAADYLERMDREHAAQYRLYLSPQSDSLIFSGLIALGSTRKFRTLLLEHPTVRRLILSSPGGNIYEARGMAKAVMEYELATHVKGECSSACTLVFAAGKPRTLAPAARLGFHQYRLEQSRLIPNVDPAREQKRDREFFLSRGFSPEFVTSIFQARPFNIWFPSQQQLLTAQAIQRTDRVE